MHVRARATTHGVLWDKYRQAMGDIALPRPFDELALIARLADRRGRPIELIPVDALPNLPCGLLMVTDQADCIVYATDTSVLHQRHILLHEAAHLICGHHETAPAASAAAQVLLPHLSPALVRRVLGRSVYTEPQEQEAELVASLILTRTAHQAGSARPAPPPHPQRARLDRLFGVPDGQAPGRGHG